MGADPTHTDPDKYRVLFENERVRVLDYHDRPGDRTSPHGHPDSVMVTLTAFDRRLIHGEREAEVHLEAGEVRWIAAQEHSGENTGTTETRSIFVELKDPAPGSATETDPLGPSA